MFHPDTALRIVDPHVGLGVFATRPLPRGTVTWVLDPFDQVFSPARYERLAPRLQEILLRYAWQNENGDRTLCWDHGRFVNHSCEPNTCSPGTVMLEIAVRDIEAGEEITNEYATLNLEETLDCACGTPSCRGLVSRDDFEDQAPSIDRLLRAAVPFSTAVPQGLDVWLTDRQRKLLAAWAAEPSTMPSVLCHRLALGAVER